MEWDGWIDAMRCDAIRRRLGDRADREACAHAYRAETGSLGNVIHEPPADWQPGRAGHDQPWTSHWPQWGPVNLTPLRLCPAASIRLAAAANRLFPKEMQKSTTATVSIARKDSYSSLRIIRPHQ